MDVEEGHTRAVGVCYLTAEVDTRTSLADLRVRITMTTNVASSERVTCDVEGADEVCAALRSWMASLTTTP